MNKLEKDYNSLFIKLHNDNKKDDNEGAHATQDELYRKFIKDIRTKKFLTLQDIKKLANDMNKNVVKYDKNRWYA